jgi:metaxin
LLLLHRRRACCRYEYCCSVGNGNFRRMSRTPQHVPSTMHSSTNASTRSWTMSADDKPQHSTPSSQTNTTSSNDTRRQATPARSIFSVPAPIKQLFDKFPLLTYPANDLPLRAPRNRDEHILYVFANQDIIRDGGASFNPNCLKWQVRRKLLGCRPHIYRKANKAFANSKTYMKFSNIKFRIRLSNNHASPSGALPFLIPASSEDASATKNAKPIPSAKLQRWCMDNAGGNKIEESGDMRYEAYLSLLDLRIRSAWVRLPP